MQRAIHAAVSAAETIQRMPLVLLTGATGYIGSHTWLALQRAGFDVVGVDDFSNSSPEVLNRLQQLGGSQPDF